DNWKKFLRPTGSIFLNLGDTYSNKGLVGIPSKFEEKARESGWVIRNKIIWAKNNGIPSSAHDRLTPRHEPIYHLVHNKNDYYYDLHAYSKLYGNGSNPGDVWRISHDQNSGGHLAPFPKDLVRRTITLACPAAICNQCGEPRRRERKRGLTNLDTNRKQAKRALEIFENKEELTLDHIRAIQATGISDVGKAQEFQRGAGANDD
ncbi:MAG: DNA methyltransferase, partial [Halobacteriaceae archaeon]